MFVKSLSTRHTAVGTFRFGVVYDVDDKNPQVRKVMKALMDGPSPAMKRLSEDEAQAEQSKAVVFDTEKPDPDAKATASDLRGALKAAKRAQKTAETDLTALEGKCADLETALAQAEVAQVASDARIAELEAELAAVQASDADATTDTGS